MSGKSTVTQEVVMESDRGVTYSCDITWECWTENYGADADGNRGEMRDEIEITEMHNFKREGKAIDEKKVPKNVMDKFEAAEPEGHEDDGYDPDFEYEARRDWEMMQDEMQEGI